MLVETSGIKVFRTAGKTEEEKFPAIAVLGGPKDKPFWDPLLTLFGLERDRDELSRFTRTVPDGEREGRAFMRPVERPRIISGELYGPEGQRDLVCALRGAILPAQYKGNGNPLIVLARADGKMFVVQNENEAPARVVKIEITFTSKAVNFGLPGRAEPTIESLPIFDDLHLTPQRALMGVLWRQANGKRVPTVLYGVADKRIRYYSVEDAFLARGTTETPLIPTGDRDLDQATLQPGVILNEAAIGFRKMAISGGIMITAEAVHPQKRQRAGGLYSKVWKPFPGANEGTDEAVWVSADPSGKDWHCYIGDRTQLGRVRGMTPLMNEEIRASAPKPAAAAKTGGGTGKADAKAANE